MVGLGITKMVRWDRTLPADAAFSEILNITSDVFGPPETRAGNSIQDLRLSYMGWTFAQLIYGGELITRQQCSTWISQNLGN